MKTISDIQMQMPEGWKVLEATWIPGPYNWRQYLIKVVIENPLLKNERMEIGIRNESLFYIKGATVIKSVCEEQDSILLDASDVQALRTILGALIESHAMLEMDKRDFAEEQAKKENPE